MKIAFLASRSPKAQDALSSLTARYGNCHPASADVLVALGGDGFMLEALHGHADRELPVYGMNRGTVGFLMNSFDEQDLPARIEAADSQSLHPLKLTAVCTEGLTHTAYAINEVSILRQGPQAANIRILINGLERMDNLMGDGAILATPAGSTAYNYSAYGPILPLGSDTLALTPIAAFRPRRWRGAVLPSATEVVFENADPEKRPLMVSADSFAIKDVIRAEVIQDPSLKHTVLFDPGHSLEERILREQFM